jgi:hypothetical protein
MKIIVSRTFEIIPKSILPTNLWIASIGSVAWITPRTPIPESS